MILYGVLTIIIILLVWFSYSEYKTRVMFYRKFGMYYNSMNTLGRKFNELEDKTCLNEYDKVYDYYVEKKLHLT